MNKEFLKYEYLNTAYIYTNNKTSSIVKELYQKNNMLKMQIFYVFEWIH